MFHQERSELSKGVLVINATANGTAPARSGVFNGWHLTNLHRNAVNCALSGTAVQGFKFQKKRLFGQ